MDTTFHTSQNSNQFLTLERVQATHRDLWNFVVEVPLNSYIPLLGRQDLFRCRGLKRVNNHGSKFMGNGPNRDRRSLTTLGRGTLEPSQCDGGIGGAPSRSADPSLGSSNSTRRRRPNALGDRRIGPSLPSSGCRPRQSTRQYVGIPSAVRVKNVAMQDLRWGGSSWSSASSRFGGNNGLVVTRFYSSLGLDPVVRRCYRSLCFFGSRSHYHVSKEIVICPTNCAPQRLPVN